MKLSWKNIITGERESAECPSMEELQDMMSENVSETPICHCPVAPNVICRHGRPSWFRVMGFIPAAE